MCKYRQRAFFEWSHQRIWSTVSKARVPLQNSIKHSGSERVKVIVVAEITEEETLRPRTINTHGQLFEEFFMRY